MEEAGLHVKEVELHRKQQGLPSGALRRSEVSEEEEKAAAAGVQQVERPTGAEPRTCLIGGDVERDILVGVAGGQLRHAVDGLQQEAVVGVGLQVGHHHRGVGHAQPPRQEAHAGAALLQATPLWQQPPAQHVVAHVTTAARVGRRRPLQEHAGLVDVGDGTAGGRGRTWKRRRWWRR